MIIIGIDPSLTGTGIASHDSLVTITSKPQGTALEARWLRLASLTDRIDQVATGADLVVIEAPSLGQARQGGTLDRNGLWWMLIDRLLTRAIAPTVVEVSPATLKKFATGKGNATKPDMRMALFQRADIDCRDDNQVDAWWLRQLGLHLIAGPDRVDLPKTHLAALDKVVIA